MVAYRFLLSWIIRIIVWIAKRASTLTMEPTIRVKITAVALVGVLTVQIKFVALDLPIIVRIVTTTFMVSNANDIILSPNYAKPWKHVSNARPSTPSSKANVIGANMPNAPRVMTGSPSMATSVTFNPSWRRKTNLRRMGKVAWRCHALWLSMLISRQNAEGIFVANLFAKNPGRKATAKLMLNRYIRSVFLFFILPILMIPFCLAVSGANLVNVSINPPPSPSKIHLICSAYCPSTPSTSVPSDCVPNILWRLSIPVCMTMPSRAPRPISSLLPSRPVMLGSNFESR